MTANYAVSTALASTPLGSDIASKKGLTNPDPRTQGVSSACSGAFRAKMEHANTEQGSRFGKIKWKRGMLPHQIYAPPSIVPAQACRFFSNCR